MIVVTGASRGLGRAICDRLLQSNIEVFGLARDTSGLPFPAQDCDVASYDTVKQAAKAIRRTGQPVHGLINAAGIASMNLALTTPESVSQRIMATNLLGTIYCCQHFAPLMIRNRGGAIINFSTIAVALGLKGESIYAASKAGVEGFTRAFAREMADFGVNVNCIAPGPIDTSLLKGITPAQIANIVAQQIIPTQFTADAVCDLTELLLDPKSRSLSGQILNVGGV
ncbi:SDR family NAD(P)-dependent oxidoreductase [Pseudoduganella aquatica]|uniref:SDR family NAD(P)-dependent oxidoreductase n=1 Tax=Pseudoduganella aquatica TaxID=2660641 RepID=A0A7X4HFX7_9BURK|nr:SDR family oxidoreductase [Pseudoduganella aquatica]MYN09722.1 SDR family NAD(P)-dependent oxidoreductase [Pseudoduganella aquatica]